MTVTMNQLWALVAVSAILGILLTYLAQLTYRMWLLGKPSHEVHTFEIIAVTQHADDDQERETSQLFYSLAEADTKYAAWLDYLHEQMGTYELNWFTIDLTRIHDGKVMQEDAS